nr:hypothetical protein [Nocardia farcinica]
MRVLRESGLVRDETEGRHRYYVLDTGPLTELSGWLGRGGGGGGRAGGGRGGGGRGAGIESRQRDLGGQLDAGRHRQPLRNVDRGRDRQLAQVGKAQVGQVEPGQFAQRQGDVGCLGEHHLGELCGHGGQGRLVGRADIGRVAHRQRREGSRNREGGHHR